MTNDVSGLDHAFDSRTQAGEGLALVKAVNLGMVCAYQSCLRLSVFVVIGNRNRGQGV